MECTIDCGCTVTSMRLGGMLNRRLASMTSSPLFISVDELMVTTGPIFQVGWFNACSGVISVICSRFQPRNGPPEAVTTSFETSPCVPERNDCQMAECSESTGLICWARTCASNSKCPPATTDSLLASASCDPACSAAMEGSSPMDPVMPFNTTSAPDPAMATTASGPAVISTLPAPACFNASRSAFAELSLKTATFETWNCAACWARSSTWEPPAASPTTSKRSRWREMTSRPWVPMDPVDPRMTTVEVCMGYACAPYCFCLLV